MNERLRQHINETRVSIQRFCFENMGLIETGRCRNHPGAQSQRGGLQIHMLQVVEAALQMNQTCDRQEVIECCLVHDLKGCESLPLTEAQRLAIGATKGRVPWEVWRPSGHHRFVALILIADMWSAFINEDDRNKI